MMSDDLAVVREAAEMTVRIEGGAMPCPRIVALARLVLAGNVEQRLYSQVIVIPIEAIAQAAKAIRSGE